MKTKLPLFFLLIGLFVSVNSSAQISSDSLNPMLIEPQAEYLDQFQCRFERNKSVCFIKLIRQTDVYGLIQNT